MNRNKIDYGIDLGTTNSAIARVDNGEIKIIKSDRYMKDTTPSCVYYTKKRSYSGDDAHNRANQAYAQRLLNSEKEEIDVYTEFKRSMGTDTRFNSLSLGKQISPEMLSSEILLKLKTYVKDDDVLSAVITVPAKFRQNQIDATQRAAELAGFQYCELLQEPIAASIAFGIEASNTNGHWLVFDFGGGTFDAALMKSEEGIIKVIDTDGDNRLGGKNLDISIIENILVPYLGDNYNIKNVLKNEQYKKLLSDRLKFFADEIKISFSSSDLYHFVTDVPVLLDDDDNEVEIDLKITEGDFSKAVQPILLRTIEISNRLLSNNQIKGSDLDSIVLVGGPTQLKIFRDLIRENISDKVNVSIDPMTAIARGAAIYASTRDIPSTIRKIDKTKIQLNLRYPETTVELEEPFGLSINRDQTEGDIPNIIYVEIVRSDQGWSSGRIEIKDDAEIISIHLIQGKANTFEIRLFDESSNSYPCEPSTITITQGIKIANATLPYPICIDVNDTVKGKQLIVPLKGLEKNATLPAKGKSVLRVPKDIRPSDENDIMRIPVYEGVPFTRSSLNEYAGELIITGKQLPQFLPKDSDAEITIYADSSRRLSVSVFFPQIDETIDYKFPENIQKIPEQKSLAQEINKAKSTLNLMVNSSFSVDEKKINNLIEEINQLENELKPDDDARVTVQERLRTAFIEIDSMQEEQEWPFAEEQLDAALDHARKVCNRFGDETAAQTLANFERHAETIKKEKSVNLAQELKESIVTFDYDLMSRDIGFWVSLIKEVNDDFDIIQWSDRRAAQDLLVHAKRIISTQPNYEQLRQCVILLFQLMPEQDRPILDGIDDTLLKR